MKNFARAKVYGGIEYPNITGVVDFMQRRDGVIVSCEIYNLPPYERRDGKVIGPFAFHIHEGSSCDPGTEADPFPETGMHFNPEEKPHPYHAGDLPTLIAMDNGFASMSFYTNRFHVEDVIGRVVVIHNGPDDYVSQPAGNSGTKIACGVIR